MCGCQTTGHDPGCPESIQGIYDGQGRKVSPLPPVSTPSKLLQFRPTQMRAACLCLTAQLVDIGVLLVPHAGGWTTVKHIDWEKETVEYAVIAFCPRCGGGLGDRQA